MDSRDDDLTVSRRTVLGGLAATPAGFALSSRADAPTVTVMTRNLYVGADLSRLFAAQSRSDLRRIAGELLDEVGRHPYEARMDAIAAEIEAAGAAVVGLQEAALIRTQRPGDFGDESSEAATDVVVDVLDELVSALAARGLDYEVAASTVTTDVEFPADGGDGVVDLRHTDRVAVLVRSDVETRDQVTGRYDERVDVPVPGSAQELTLKRGYCLLDVVADGSEFTVAATHLESLVSTVRTRQASELLDRLPTAQPVVVLGDFNSGPGTTTEAYDRLTATLEDAHAVHQSDEDTVTCCQPPDLRNSESRLDKGVDAVLTRGDVHPVAVEYVGEERADRVPARVDGEDVLVWPSDHAGVVASVELRGSTPSATPTATPTQTPTRTPPDDATARENGSSDGTQPRSVTPTATPKSSGSGPGFGAVAAVGASAVAAVTALVVGALGDRPLSALSRLRRD